MERLREEDDRYHRELTESILKEGRDSVKGSLWGLFFSTCLWGLAIWVGLLVFNWFIER